MGTVVGMAAATAAAMAAETAAAAAECINTAGAYPSDTRHFSVLKEKAVWSPYKIRNKKQKFLRNFMHYGKRTIAFLREKVYDKGQ